MNYLRVEKKMDREMLLSRAGCDLSIKTLVLFWNDGDEWVKAGFFLGEVDGSFSVFVPGNRPERCDFISEFNEKRWRRPHVLIKNQRNQLSISTPHSNGSIYFCHAYATRAGEQLG